MIYGGEWFNGSQRFGPSIICLDGNGSLLWGREIGYPYSDSVFYAGRLYVCSDDDLMEIDQSGQITRCYTSRWGVAIRDLAIGPDGSFHFIEIPNKGKSTLYATGGFPENTLLDAIINNILWIVAVVLGAALIIFLVIRHRRGR